MISGKEVKLQRQGKRRKRLNLLWQLPGQLGKQLRKMRLEQLTRKLHFLIATKMPWSRPPASLTAHSAFYTPGKEAGQELHPGAGPAHQPHHRAGHPGQQRTGGDRLPGVGRTRVDVSRTPGPHHLNLGEEQQEARQEQFLASL